MYNSTADTSNKKSNKESVENIQMIETRNQTASTIKNTFESDSKATSKNQDSQLDSIDKLLMKNEKTNKGVLLYKYLLKVIIISKKTSDFYDSLLVY